jgi:hypothetical protein
MPRPPGAPSGYLTATEALDPTKEKLFFADHLIWMWSLHITGSDLTMDFLGGDGTKGTPIGKLRFGHVYLGVPSPLGLGHIVVVYGVGYPDGKVAQISMMDPLYGYRNRPFTDYSSKPDILVAWPR